MRIQTEIPSNILQAISVFASTDETRYALNGVLFEFGVGARVVATDGRKLGVIQFNDTVHDHEISFTLAGEVVEIIKQTNRVIPLEIENEDGFLVVKAFLNSGVLECTEENSGLVERKFPKWRQVIPNESQCAIPQIAINGDNLAAFHTAATHLYPASELSLQFTSANGCIVIKMYGAPEFLGVLMPLRSESQLPAYLTSIPQWAKPITA